MIKLDEETIDRVLFLRRQFTANEVAHQNRRKRQGEQRRRCHRISFRVGQRLEQSAFLRLQRKYWNERHRNDQQRVKERRSYFD